LGSLRPWLLGIKLRYGERQKQKNHEQRERAPECTCQQTLCSLRA
jgi:hypothetical protein